MGIDADELRKLLEEAGIEGEPASADQPIGAPGSWNDATEQPEDLGANGPDVVPALRRTPERGASGDDAPPTNAAIYFRDISAATLLNFKRDCRCLCALVLMRRLSFIATAFWI